MTTHNDDVPDVIIRNREVRAVLGGTLFLVGLLASIAALLFAFFPELAYGTDIPARAIAFVNAVTSFLASAFGLVVSTPNVPRVR